MKALIELFEAEGLIDPTCVSYSHDLAQGKFSVLPPG
jgi:hypothetical protein